MPAQAEFQQRLKTIEELLGRVEAAADPNLRTTVQELVQLVMDLHGSGLERMLELIRTTADEAETVIQKLGRDELVASLLVLYGLHPLDLEARVMQAIDKARGRLRTHEGELDLLSIQDGAVRLRLRASGHGCGSTPQSLKEIVEECVYQTAPDITSLSIEGAADRQAFVPIDMVQAATPVSFINTQKGGL